MIHIIFRVHRISDNQIETFCSILQEAAVWLRRQGQEMWKIEHLSVENMLGQYSASEMFMGYIDEIPAATMILQEVDEEFWSTVPKNESLFLHKLSVKRQFAKSGLTTEMINWAKTETQRRKKSFLRLDCAADRPKLIQFYESHDFKKVKEQVMGQYPTAFFEWEVSTIL